VLRPRVNAALGGALALAVAFALAASCKPHRGPQLDSNGSDPPDGGGAIANNYANDPALTVWTQYGKPDRLLLAYTDESGLYDADLAAQRLVPKPTRSANGISYSDDLGKTWTRVGPIAPASASCTHPTCAVALAGMPAMSPVETIPSINLVSLAFTRTDLDVPDAIAAMSTSDLVHWSEPRVVVNIAGRPPTRPSISRRNATSVMAFTDRVRGQLFVASAESDPPVFRLETPTGGRTEDDDAFKDHAIVRLTTNEDAHIAYVIPRSEDGATFDLRIIHLFRSVNILGDATPWHASTIFVMNKITIDPTLSGALGRAWRDAYPFAFDVGDTGNHFYLAYRQRSTSSGQSEIWFVDCDSTEGGNCSIEDTGQLSSGWRIRHFPGTTFTGGQFMPVIGADRYSTAMSLAWLQETAPASGSFTLMGMHSIDSSDTLTPPSDLRAGNGGAWSPCPTAAAVAANVHSYGERSASIVVPWDSTVSPTPSIITAHTDSSYGCRDLGELTFDQHIGIATW
jgi:hypothetical protein